MSQKTTSFWKIINFRFRSWPAIHIQNLLNRCRYKYDPSISQNFQSYSWCFFCMFRLTVGRTVGRSVLRTNKGRKARQRLRRPWRLCDEEAKKKPDDFSSWQRGRIKQPRKVEHTVSPEGVKLQPVWNKHIDFAFNFFTRTYYQYSLGSWRIVAGQLRNSCGTVVEQLRNSW